MRLRRMLGKPRFGASVSALALWALSNLASGEEVVLNLRGFAQEADEWCWAASTQSVLDLLAPELGAEACQCRLAESRLKGLRCCQAERSCAPRHPLDAACRDPGWPQIARYGFDVKTTCDPMPEPDWDYCTSEALSWEALSRELDSGRPVVSAFRPTAIGKGIGHTSVIFGRRTTREDGEEDRWVLVFDPKRVCRETGDRSGPPRCRGDAWWFSYHDYRAPEGSRHWITFYGLARKTADVPGPGARGSSRTGGSGTKEK